MPSQPPAPPSVVLPRGEFALLAREVALRWPELLAWFFAGWVARILLLRLAGHLGNIDAIWGLLVLPLAVLARLISYVAMFLVVRDALGADGPAESTPRRGRWRRKGRALGESVLDAILPFFVIYAAWSIIEQDIIDYARSALDQIDFDTVQPGQGPLTVSIGVLSVTLVLVAFGLRMVLRALADRVPQWIDAMSVYLEAVWVLVTVLVLRTLLAGVPEWLASRRMIAWSLDRLDDLRESVAFFGSLVDGIGPVWGVLSDVVLLPLAWLALAAVVFAGALSGSAGTHDPRSVARLREHRAAMSSRRRRLLDLAAEGFLERWEPVRHVATIAWRAGPLPIATYVLAFGVLQASAVWLDRLISVGLGPHPAAWWSGISGTSGLAVEAITTPLQLALVAGALSYLTRLSALRSRAGAPEAASSDR